MVGRDSHLNLARKWRSKTFNEIVGQKLTIKLLKNSLYKNLIFPVYLLAGLRGSGKTSIGRIFAAALNCQALDAFRKNPQSQQLPCLECSSCTLMMTGNHPDFIEIDAASHTGVDNVRHIIETAGFLPVVGTKKIYLIDEAHMLSKAAFNAFLKILEEPPATAVFLLATTDAQKIIDTVKSRSFQLFFDPIAEQDLIEHLIVICTAEKITYDREGLALIVQESEGSVRDALNSIERIRLAEGALSVAAVSRVLGTIHDRDVIRLFEVMGQGSLQELFSFLQEIQLNTYNSLLIWKKLVLLTRSLIWAHHGSNGISSTLPRERIIHLMKLYPIPLITEFLDMLYKIESMLQKTSAHHALLENLLCKMVQRLRIIHTKSADIIEHGRSEEEIGEKKNEQPKSIAVLDSTDHWQRFIHAIRQKGNPIALSIFQQGKLLEQTPLVVKIGFVKKFAFYADWFANNTALWKSAFEQVFGAATFVPDFSTEEPPAAQVAPRIQEKQEYRGPVSLKKTSLEQSSKTLDVSDANQWRTAQMLLRVFPGTVKILK